MKLSYITVPNTTPVKMLTATSTYGVGFGTSILLFFCNLFGTECNSYSKKVEMAKNSAIMSLVEKANGCRADGIMDIRYQIHNLTVFVYGVAYTEDVGNNPNTTKETEAPENAEQSNEKVSRPHFEHHYDTWKCAHCGANNQSFTSICKNCGNYKS